jgi:hypothetical protein
VLSRVSSERNVVLQSVKGFTACPDFKILIVLDFCLHVESNSKIKSQQIIFVSLSGQKGLYKYMKLILINYILQIYTKY